MTAPVAAQRILRGVKANIDAQFLDQDGEPADAAGTVTVDVARADGTVIATGASTSIINNGDGHANSYRYTLAADDNDRLDLLQLTWHDGTDAVLTDAVDVVGGFYFTVAELRAFDTRIDNDLASDAKVRRIRREVEDSCERITGTAWVPRYRRKNYSPITGTQQHAWGWNTTLQLDDWNPRRVRSVRVYSTPATFTEFSADELASIVLHEWGAIERGDLGAWLSTYGGTIIELEHGYDRPTSELKHAAMTHARYLLYRETTGIPDRATSFQLAEGGTFQIATPGVGPFETGLPDVDAVYKRHKVSTGIGIA